MEYEQFEQWMKDHPIFLNIYNELFLKQIWVQDDHHFRYTDMSFFKLEISSLKENYRKNQEPKNSSKKGYWK